VHERVQLEALTGIWHLQRNLTRWLLSRPGQTLDIAGMVGRLQAPFAELVEAMPSVLTEADRKNHAAARHGHESSGLSPGLAHFMASLPYLNAAFDIIELSQRDRHSVISVAKTHFALSDALHIDWLMQGIEGLPVNGRWQAQARGVLRDELQAQQRQLVSTVLASADHAKAPADWVMVWLSRDDAGLKYTLGMLSDMRGLSEMDFPTLSVAVRRLAQIASTGLR
jgi:glutamate dehydrogenase